MMSNSNTERLPWPWILVTLLALAALLVFGRRLALLVLLFLTTTAVMAGLYYLTTWLLGLRKKRDLSSRIEEMRGECTAQIVKYREELGEIEQNLNEITASQRQSQALNPQTHGESERLRAAFEHEKRLRLTKIGFYETCRAKLENLLYNQMVAQQLAEKQHKLSQLQEGHHEDLAKMEQLRTELDYEKDFLESIGQLSLRMADSHSLDAAEELQLELEEITKELRRL
ncbi:MAG: hypothetical protein AAFW73_05480 [Bacteroidota bacterium]